MKTDSPVTTPVQFKFGRRLSNRHLCPSDVGPDRLPQFLRILANIRRFERRTRHWLPRDDTSDIIASPHGRVF